MQPGQALPAITPGTDAEVAARALFAVLGNSATATRVDERLFEALLTYGLQFIPRLGAELFGCAADVTFSLGARGIYADIIGMRAGDIVVECEVKLHSNINWSARGVCQLDNYAGNATSADLTILTAKRRIPKLSAELASDIDVVESRVRWRILHEQDLLAAVQRAAGTPTSTDRLVERFTLALARLVDTEKDT